MITTRAYLNFNKNIVGETIELFHRIGSEQQDIYNMELKKDYMIKALMDNLAFNMIDLIRLGVDIIDFYKEAEEKYKENEFILKLIQCSKDNSIYYGYEESQEIIFA